MYILKGQGRFCFHVFVNRFLLWQGRPSTVKLFRAVQKIWSKIMHINNGQNLIVLSSPQSWLYCFIVPCGCSWKCFSFLKLKTFWERGRQSLKKHKRPSLHKHLSKIGIVHFAIHVFTSRIQDVTILKIPTFRVPITLD